MPNNILSNMQYVRAGFEHGEQTRKQNALAQLNAAAASGAEPNYSAIAANGGNPLAFRDDARKQEDVLRESLGRDAAMLLAAPPEHREALYQQNLPKYRHFFQAAPANYTPQLDPILEQLAGSAGGPGGSVQSKYVRGDGMVIAVMRDGSQRELGPAQASYSPFVGSDGVYGFDRHGNTAAPTMVGGGMPQQAPQQAPTRNVQFDFAPGTSPEVMAATRSYAAADGSMQPQGGQQLQAPTKAAADDAPSGYRWNADHTALVAIPGGPAANKEGAALSMGDTSLTGDSYLATLKPNEAAQVRALAEGRMAFPSGTALKSPHWQAMLEAVSQYDPEFDAVNYNARSKTRGAFVAGSEGKTINALNTVAEHLGQFSDNAEALGNFDLPVLNKVKNAYLSQTGDPRIAAFNTSKKAVADEVARVWRATGGSEADIQENLKNLDGAQSPEQLNAAIGTLTELIYGKINALQDQYNSGMGTTRTPRPLVSPGAQKAFDKTLQRMRGGSPSAPAAAPVNNAPPASAPNSGDYSHLWSH